MPYPLLFEPIYKEKVWGGQTLASALDRDLPGGEGTKIGESWELVDLRTTRASGGGGSAEHSRIANGPLAGQTLGDVIRHDHKPWLGELTLNEFDEFPLLLKFLDARENLSVQVHPSAAYAAEHDEAYLKSEAWYVVAAEPGAKIYKGVREGVTPEQLRAAIEKNTNEAVVPLLIDIEVKAGDCHYLPSGTCHALGAGILVAEVQTPSDTTFRVYDWGRTGRELHVEQALACIDFGPPDVARYESGTRVEGLAAEVTKLVECEYFRIDRVRATSPIEEELNTGATGGPVVWMGIEGRGRVTCDGSPDVEFGKGDTLYLPPGMQGARAKIEAGAVWLEVTFPQAKRVRIA